MSIVGLPAPDYSGVALTPVDRLQRLLLDKDYVTFARALVARLRDEIRDSVKEWAGLMMWAEDSQQLLNYLGIFAETHLSRIEYLLAGWQTETAARSSRIVATLWCLTDVKGRALMNTLWGSYSSYQFAMPPGADGIRLKDAFGRTNSVGRWTPPELGYVPQEREPLAYRTWAQRQLYRARRLFTE